MLANDYWNVGDDGSLYACMASDGLPSSHGLINTMMNDPKTVVRTLLGGALNSGNSAVSLNQVMNLQGWTAPGGGVGYGLNAPSVYPSFEQSMRGFGGNEVSYPDTTPSSGWASLGTLSSESSYDTASTDSGGQVDVLYSQPESQDQTHDIKLQPGQSRHFTNGEIALGKTVYPDIDYSKPEICRCKAYFFQPSDRAMSPDGGMYFNPSDQGYYDDFSQAPIQAQHTFIHELGHIYQNQVEDENVRTAVFNRNYNYWPLAPGKTFSQYGLEQQAEMVADYFMLKRFGMMYPNLLNQIPRPTADDYEKVVPHVYQAAGSGQ